MTTSELTMAMLAFAAVIAAVLSWLRAGAAVKAAQGANRIAEQANRNSVEANTIARDANAFSREANAISREANDISREANSFVKEQQEKRLSATVRWESELGLANFDRQGVRKYPCLVVEITNLGPDVYLERVEMVTGAEPVPLLPSDSSARDRKIKIERNEPKEFRSGGKSEGQSDWDVFMRSTLLLIETTCGKTFAFPFTAWEEKAKEPFSSEESNRLAAMIFESAERRANWQQI